MKIPDVFQTFFIFSSVNLYIVVVTKKPSVSNYAFITLLQEWVDRGQTHQLEKLLGV